MGLTATAGAGPWPPDSTVVVGDVVIASADEVHEPGWVAVAGDTIVAVGAGPPPAGLPVLASGDLVMPGMVSAHQHLTDLLVLGGPTGPTFLDWLLGTFHAGLAHAGPEECAAAVATVRAGTLAAGVTTMVDCWSVGPVDEPGRWTECAEASIEAHVASGGRTVFAPMFLEHVPTGWADAVTTIDPARLCRPADVTLAEVEDLAASGVSAGGRLTVTPSPELPETVGSDGLRDALALAARLDGVLPIHLCASPPARAAYGPDELGRDGLLDRRVLGAHVSAVEDADIAMLGGAGLGVAHCPSAARALGAERLTPVARLRAAGARCGIGLDNASLHTGRDLFEEGRQAALAASAAGEPLDPVDRFRMLTAEGADAVGLAGRIGALAPGHRADLVVLDTSGPHWWPRADIWPATVVDRARADDVTLVLVDGRVVARDGVPTTGDRAPEVDRAATRIRTSMGW